MESDLDEKKINFASRVYEKTAQAGRDNFSTKLSRGFYERLWKFLIKLRVLPPDPIIRRKIGKRDLLVNASHKLPNKLRRLPFYDSTLPRIAVFLKEKRGNLLMIDVGANIGDTINLISDAVDGSFLCVEPSEKYFQLLKANTRNLPNVICEQVAVSNSSSDAEKILAEFNGTASLTERKSTVANVILSETLTAVTTIDDLIVKHSDFSQTSLLKIDTDGYDIKALKSAASLLSNSQPLVFIEFSPWHLTNIGGDNPLDLFSFATSNGYSLALFYDNHGYLFTRVSLNEPESVRQIILYAKRKPGFYLDVLLFPDSCKKEFDEFYFSEIRQFPDVELQ